MIDVRSKTRGLKKHIIAALLKHGEISPSDFAKRNNYKVSSVTAAFNRLYREGLIYLKRKHGKHSIYALNQDKAREYISKTYCNLGGGARSPNFFGRFLDLEGAVFVGQRVDVDLDGFQAGLLRGCGLFSGGGNRDRAGQVSYCCREFSLVLSRHGHLRIDFKVPDLGPFVEFLKSCGFDDFNVQVVLERVLMKLDVSRMEVEVPLKHRVEGRFKVETRLGDKYLAVSNVRSHFPGGELEVKGSALLVQNFISVLAGVQHFSMLEYAQLQESQKYNENMIKIFTALTNLVNELKEDRSREQNIMSCKNRFDEGKPDYYL